MIKKGLFCVLLAYGFILIGQTYDFKPRITEREMEIFPRIGETCYQYAERKVEEMKAKYPEDRIVGSDWLSAYWAHHYEGALIYRNYYWKPV